MAKITLEKLAQMVGNGFNEMGEKFKQVDNQIKEVEVKLYEMDTDIRYIRAELSEVKNAVIGIQEDTVPPLEFEDLSGRVKYVERKLVIKSGK